MRYFSFKSVLATSLVLSLLIAVAPTPARATLYDVSGIPVKNTGDAFTAAELNLVINMLRNLKQDDLGDGDVTNDRFGIGIAGTPGYKLDVNGTVNASAFIGDGSQLTNLPNPSPWVKTASDIYFNTGKVAIGINSSPTYELEVQNTAGDSDLSVEASGTNDASVRLINGNQHWIIRNNGGAGGNFQIYNSTSGTTVFDVDNTTNNIATSNNLAVGGDITGDTITATTFINSATGLPVTGKFVDGTNTNNAVYMDGNVGIGTTSNEANG